ncbi:hypothetical protein AGLY_015070 [Aphis glycines]|uniref:Reverse transcriptase domain-containing protein n=1 Tax=Aphis glycines TaxID=307491 RepID=A0A6G0T2Z4_APHGL|nr:hypothetical protein AGLY_015070 [Aphis glycines]
MVGGCRTVWKAVQNSIAQDEWSSCGGENRTRLSEDGDRQSVSSLPSDGLWNCMPFRASRHFFRGRGRSHCQAILEQKEAPGPDNITNRIIGEVHKIYPVMLAKVYNQCLVEGTVPARWKESRVVLLRKGNKPEGVPSSYRPLLLNITYNSVLKTVLPKVAELIGFADDTLVVAYGRTTSEFESAANVALEIVARKISSLDLAIAVEKTQALICGRRLIRQRKSASNSAGSCPTLVDRARAAVVPSVLLYDAPLWADTLEVVPENVRQLNKTQRKVLLCSIRGYRSVSEVAVGVLVSTPPADLLAMERRKLFIHRRTTANETEAKPGPTAISVENAFCVALRIDKFTW